jgi:hypothetical protein
LEALAPRCNAQNHPNEWHDDGRGGQVWAAHTPIVGKHNTAPAAEYPTRLCQWLAFLCTQVAHRGMATNIFAQEAVEH